MLPWFVVHTKPRKEETAVRHLQRRGLDTFLPRICYSRTVVPLFPGYLFARVDFERNYSAVTWAPGVKRLVGFGGIPCPVAEDVVAFLRARAGADSVIRPSPLLPGEKVMVKTG